MFHEDLRKGGLIADAGSYRIRDPGPGEAGTFRAEYGNVREKELDRIAKCRDAGKVV